jgi:ribonuclease BN (tRNA processing enzyme)
VLLTLLGTAGHVPHGSRETCCALLSDGAAALLIDAGSGVRRLVEQPDLLAGVTRLDVLLTHFHLDHTIGLSFVPALGLDRLPTVHGPGAALYGIPTEDILRRTFARPQSAMDLDAIGRAADVAPPEAAIGPFRVRLRRQDGHPDPTLAVRVGDAFCLCTDTGPDPATAAFAAGVRVLLHDVWGSAADLPPPDARHTGAGDAAALAARAGARELVFIHRNPLVADYGPLLDEARAVFPASRLGRDLDAIPT